MKPKFSLKDQLFNPTKVQLITDSIQSVYPDFEAEKFQQVVVQKFSELELKQRIIWIRECLKTFLPDTYETALKILLKSLPPELDPEKTDDDFGDFIWAPYSDFVAYYGCEAKYFDLSMAALKTMTKRFSVEDSIRYFINKFPEKTIDELEKWSSEKNYHIRRLVSEGTRPKLPWSQKINISPQSSIQLLDNLFADKTRYVTRSVANHLNDISKTDPDLVLAKLTQWKKSARQTEAEINFIINHSLRTLIKKGHKETMIFLGFDPDPNIEINNLTLKKQTILIGESLNFSFDITSKNSQNLIIDYVIHFQKKSGQLSPKVFKLKKISLEANQTISINKSHPLRIMSTRKLYPGEHKVSIQVNGKIVAEQNFLIFTPST
jgi:3-methyladenine DNA glycosylase AlkC/hemin uptake protein HemP